MLESYVSAYWGILITLSILIIQGVIAAVTKASQVGAIPGKMDEHLSHSSIVFRTNRAFMNSLENFPAMLGTSLLAILVGANVFWTGAIIWIYAIARIIHMALYYAIATEKNPSPRSYVYLIALAANIALVILCAFALMS